jgi:5-methylthioadenosine/S-adenosylhomocysteine deaminase
MDTLFSYVTAVLMDDADTVLKDAFVLVSQGKIAMVSTARPEGFSGREIDGRGKVLMPGLVNAHTHVPMTLLRGWADGFDLHTWLHEHIFPAEARFDARSVRAGTALGLAEMIAAGVTSFSDMYFFCDEIVEETIAAGLSANITQGLTSFEADFSPETHPGFIKLRQLKERWHGAEGGRIRVDACIHGEYTSPPKLWAAAADYARANGLGMHVHLSETKEEHEGCLCRHGVTPARAFDRFGVWDVRAYAAHCVWITDEDIALLAERGVTAVHNPVSNLKLGSGIARLPAMLAGGMNVALGTDGVASNNSQDLFDEIKLAATLHKGVLNDPKPVTAGEALRMATRNGALAQGRNAGRIAPGCDADLILLDFARPHLTPCHNVLSNLVFSARGSDVVLNMSGGRIIYENGNFLTIDLERVLLEIREYALPRLRAQ